MTLVTFVRPAGPHERFAEDAFRDSVGRDVPLTLPDGERRSCRLVRATVSDECDAVELTMDLPPEVVERLRPPSRPYSLDEGR